MHTVAAMNQTQCSLAPWGPTVMTRHRSMMTKKRPTRWRSSVSAESWPCTAGSSVGLCLSVLSRYKEVLSEAMKHLCVCFFNEKQRSKPAANAKLTFFCIGMLFLSSETSPTSHAAGLEHCAVVATAHGSDQRRPTTWAKATICRLHSHSHFLMRLLPIIFTVFVGVNESQSGKKWQKYRLASLPVENQGHSRTKNQPVLECHQFRAT